MIKFSGSACGKVILMGEHAVVYGHPAIAAQVDLKMHLTLAFSPDPQLPQEKRNKAPWVVAIPGILEGPQTVLFKSDDAGKPPLGAEASGRDAALNLVLSRAFNLIRPPPGAYTFHLVSDIPLGKGMGSSAALSSSLLQVLLKAADKPVPEGGLMALVNNLEAVFHGTPSGVDACMITQGGVRLFHKGPPLSHQPIEVGCTLRLVLADSGETGQTAELVGAIKGRLKRDPEGTRPLFDEIETLTLEGLEKIKRGNLKKLGPLMTQNHRCLARLGVSTEVLDRLVDLSLKNGALGAKLTGAGGGGLMMALAESEVSQNRINAALIALGFQTWTTALCAPKLTSGGVGELRSVV